MSILSLPVELLEKIVFKAGYSNYSTYTAIRLTCRVLCDIATPFVFEKLYINFSNIKSSRPEETAVLRELSSGRRLARFVRVVHFQTSITHHKPKLNRIWGAMSLFKKETTFHRTVSNLLLAAVPLMQSLEHFEWAMFERVAVDWTTLKDVVRCISTLPRLVSVSICTWKIDRDIPCGPFHHLTSLDVSGRGAIDYAPSIIANSLNLDELTISIFRYDHPSPSHFPVSSLFGAFPEGAHSSLRRISLSGNYFSLDPSTVPALIPHLHNLSSFQVPIGFEIPDEFWSALLAAMIYIQFMSCRHEGLGDSFLTYLQSCQGLVSINLRPDEPNADDERHSRFLLHNILPTHAMSLMYIYITPRHAGQWCFNSLMHHSLSFCTNLCHISICVDDEQMQVAGLNNVLVTLMNSLTLWPSLESLSIEAVVPIVFGEVKAYEPPRRDVCIRVHEIITTFQYRNPTRHMLKLRIYTDFAYRFRLRRGALPDERYSFYPEDLLYSGKRILRTRA
ncbi:hypothetical protein EDD85DRAFT_863374 [Armillaria nabsnona]|nr:hypothetical protein EDD85DRAFT_863374 [Armillaria nabsnona]